MDKNKDEDIDPTDLPESGVYTRKEVFQHPQPADSGEPLKPDPPKEEEPLANKSKEEEKTSKKEGLNEARSAGHSGAFEGFEDQSS